MQVERNAFGERVTCAGITILPNGDVKRPLPFVQLVDGKLKLDFIVQ